MGVLTALIRASSSEDVARHAAAEQSPLHVLPAPILVVLALACLVMAACVAGLTLGLMSLDSTGLGIVMRSNNTKQAAAAAAIKPVREQGNLLLVTLLFANTLATELLPLVLEALVPGGYFSLIVSVGSIMLFGEIIPQAVCSRHPLLIGHFMIGFVKVLRAILYPLAAPIAFLLDTFLGEELATIYNREELKGLIDVHQSNAVLTQDETTILKGALEFSQKRVAQILTPAEKVFKLDIDSVLDRGTLLQILRSGHSRVPLYDNSTNNIVCLLLVKQLILVNPDDNIPIRSLISKKKRNHKVRVAPALECAASTLIADLLNEFQKGRSHMAVVYDDVTKPVGERNFAGIVSIEDIIEEILQEEIVDETDAFTDNTQRTKVLVRNAEGRLVRTTALNAHSVLVPGASTAVLVKEIDVPALRAPLGEAVSGEKLRPDWKKAKARRAAVPGEGTASASSLEPLLEYGYSEDLESGAARPDVSAETINSALRTPESQAISSPRLSRIDEQTSYSDIRYARIPGYSSTSLFGEDDGILPEDMASPSYGTGGMTLSELVEVKGIDGAEAQWRERDSPKQLQVRPLPHDASGERVVQIPPRNRTTPQKLTPPRISRGAPSYGAINDPYDIGRGARDGTMINALPGDNEQPDR